MNRYAILLGLLLVTLSARAETELYLVEDLATQSDHAPVRAQAHELRAIYEDLVRVSGVEAQFVYSTDPDINAFATEVGDDKIVVVQEGLLSKFGGDRDAVAATLGHELAHHKADHIRAGRRKQEGVRVLGAILGAVVGAKVGRNSGELAGAVSGAAVGVGANLLALKFNRNQELEADRYAVAWMIEAGYNPQGMLRLQQALGALAAGKRRAAIVSTHPTSAKRLQAAEKLIAKLAPPQDLLVKPAAPLVDDASLAAATAQIGEAKQEAVAAALAPEAAAPSAAALAPIDGIGFDKYAAIGNELSYAGDAGQARVLAKHKLTTAKYAQLSAGFGSRMREEPGLMQRYSVAYFRASQGKLAAWGRDLADSYEHGQPLKLEPPFPVETARKLQAALMAHTAKDPQGARFAEFETKTLKPHGLSFYDYQLGSNWWSRYVVVAAAAGDTEPMRALYATQYDTQTEAQADESGVHIGDNVEIGDNVQVGGKPVKSNRDD